MLLRLPLAGLATLCLTLFLTACSAPVLLTPPESLLADCAHAAPPTGRTNADLADYVLREQGALDECNTDKAALRAWAAGGTLLEHRQ